MYCSANKIGISATSFRGRSSESRSLDMKYRSPLYSKSLDLSSPGRLSLYRQRNMANLGWLVLRQHNRKQGKQTTEWIMREPWSSCGMDTRRQGKLYESSWRRGGLKQDRDRKERLTRESLKPGGFFSAVYFDTVKGIYYKKRSEMQPEQSRRMRDGKHLVRRTVGGADSHIKASIYSNSQRRGPMWPWQGGIT